MADTIEPGKLFVGGLSWETDEDGMRAHFEQFGKTDEVVIMREPGQQPGIKKHKGFGFVTFKNPASVQSVLAQPVHMVDRKRIDPKQAYLKQGTSEKKCFIGGVAKGTEVDDIKAYFYQCGTPVTDVDFKYDKVTGHMRGFGFVSFETEEHMEKAIQGHFHDIKGKTVELKRAQPRHATASAQAARAAGSYAPYQQPYGGQGDYAAANGQQQYGHQFYGANSQYYPYGAATQQGYGQGYANTSYDTSAAYPRPQHTSTGGDRQDTQTSYYQQAAVAAAAAYGHSQQMSGQQMSGSYGQDPSSYGGRSAYPTAGQDGYQQQTGVYGRGAPQQQRYGGGGGGYGQ